MDNLLELIEKAEQGDCDAMYAVARYGMLGPC